MATKIDLEEQLGRAAPAEDANRVIVLDAAATVDSEPERLGPDYLKLWLATAVNNVGDGVRMTALPLLAATFTRSPILIAGVLFACKLPWLLFSLVSGAIVDRVDRRRLMILINVSRGVAMALLGVVVLTGGGGLALLYGVALAQGIGEVFADNAAFALMPNLVPRSRLEDANGRLEAAMVTMNEFAGPALGGALVALAVGLPFLLDSVSFVAAALLLTTISFRPRPVADSAPTRNIRRDIGEGLRWLWRRPLLRDLSLIAAATNLVLHATFAIAVLFALEILDLGEIGFGLLLSGEAFGALTGSLLAGSIKRRIGTRSTVVAALLIAGLANLAIASSSSWPVVAAMMIGVAFAGGLWNVVTNSLRQSLVPDRLLGRVQSTHRLLSWGAIPLGTILGGLLSQFVGLRTPFAVAGAALALLALAAGALLARHPETA
ncbi:MAG: MFS transporter [Actinomycetota bacterium]